MKSNNFVFFITLLLIFSCSKMTYEALITKWGNRDQMAMETDRSLAIASDPMDKTISKN